VFASGKNRTPTDGVNLHTNFRLSRSGEHLGLYNARGIPQLSSVFDQGFPTQLEDISYGRYGQEAEFAYLHPATPGEPNERVNAYWPGPDSWPDGNTEAPYYPWIFRQDTIMDYEFRIETAGWETMNSGGYPSPHEYVSGTVTIGQATYENIGIRFKGNVTYMAARRGLKKPFKIDFNRFVDGQDFLGVTKLNFGNSWSDPTMMREVLGYEVFAAAGSPASRTSYVNLHVTVPDLYDHELVGVYVVVEQVDRPYLAERFGNDAGNLYKAGIVDANLLWKGTDPARYSFSYKKKTNEEEDDWSDFIHFLDVLNNTPDNQFKAELETVFNIDGFLSYLAANTVLSNMDSIAGRNANFYLYNNADTGLFEFIPWDLNMSFGWYDSAGAIELDIYHPTHGIDEDHVLVDRVLAVPEYVAVYEDRIRALIDGCFSPENMTARIDELYEFIRWDVYADPHKLDSSDDFDQNIEMDVGTAIGLKRFVNERVASIREQLGD